MFEYIREYTNINEYIDTNPCKLSIVFYMTFYTDALFVHAI